MLCVCYDYNTIIIDFFSLAFVVSMGVILSGFIKVFITIDLKIDFELNLNWLFELKSENLPYQDFYCLPRPLSPPVNRLITSYHHLEYGFPSTHTTNSVSIALFILTHLLSMDNINNHNDGMTLWMKCLCFLGLLFYCASIVCGRIYCGMHSFCGEVIKCSLCSSLKY